MSVNKVSLIDYDLLINDVFYKCWHILEYIEKHPELSELDRQAIEATIMDALVSKGLIDPNCQSLDLQNMCIVNNLDHYKYEKHPNISGIPLLMKEKLRKKSIRITGGIPISMFLAKPPDKTVRYCVYDPNLAVSSIFEDATFYNAIYNSPTRGIRIEEPRPFVEVNIDGELYLVDTLTKRILKSSWFKETYDMEIKDEYSISGLNGEKLKYYKEMTSDNKELAVLIPFVEALARLKSPVLAEYGYELEQSKKYFPEEWERCEVLQKEMEADRKNMLAFHIKIKKQSENQ